MEAVAKLPLTLDERMKLGKELRIPASWEEFLDMLEECEYRIEYEQDEIISFMGFGTPNHEKIIAKLNQLLLNLLNEDLFNVFSSNLAIHIPDFVRRYYNADVAVVKGDNETVVLRGGMVAVANPVLIIEVLSASTRIFDGNVKLKNYRKIPSVQQILYLESAEMLVTSYTRVSTNEWRLLEYSTKTDEVPILEEGKIKLSDIYNKVKI
jgi:Uma2 family endonuclease